MKYDKKSVLGEVLLRQTFLVVRDYLACTSFIKPLQKLIIHQFFLKYKSVFFRNDRLEYE